jgi:D-alanine-D-alanine ligase
MTIAQKIRVGVLRGGPSSEYEISLNTGSSVLNNLPEKYAPVDIFITKYGVWHVGGVAVEPEQALRRVDVVYNALHGEYGEDGKVQHTLEQFGIPFTGSPKFPSSVAMNKLTTKKFVEQQGVKIPLHIIIKRDEYNEGDIDELLKTMPRPLVIKPVSLGSSIGVTIADTTEEINSGLRNIFEMCEKAMVEEYIEGKEATCAVTDKFRDVPVYAFLPIEIIPAVDKKLFDYNAKYVDEKTRYICPGNFTREEKDELQRLAVLVHSTLSLRHYSRSDFIVSPRGIYFLEVNSLPCLTRQSLMSKSLDSIGSSLPHFLDHIITLAIDRK